MAKKSVVKKTVKKVTPKKTVKGVVRKVKIEKVPNKPMKVTIRQQVLGEAPKEKEFYLSDGRKLKNILDLAESMEDMAEDTFKFHVNEAKNDFSNWVRDVFDEKELAEDIVKAKNKIETQMKVLKRIVNKFAKT